MERIEPAKAGASRSRVLVAAGIMHRRRMRLGQAVIYSRPWRPGVRRSAPQNNRFGRAFLR
jgi:hypothetical protein